MNDAKAQNRIVLASASPRRSSLLAEAGIAFDFFPSKTEEFSDARADPERLVEANALLKAEWVAERIPNRTVLGADTVVAFGGRIFGKPQNLDDAFEMLSILSGNTHAVFTGVALVRKTGEYACGSFMERLVKRDCSKVTFKKLSAAEIKNYLQKVPVLDKAGAYAAQEFGELIIEKIDGCFDNVMGLPVKLVKEMLAEFAAERTPRGA